MLRQQGIGVGVQGVYCICQNVDDGSGMVQCGGENLIGGITGCHEWFHMRCVPYYVATTRSNSDFICRGCQFKGSVNRVVVARRGASGRTASPAAQLTGDVVGRVHSINTLLAADAQVGSLIHLLSWGNVF